MFYFMTMMIMMMVYEEELQTNECMLLRNKIIIYESSHYTSNKCR